MAMRLPEQRLWDRMRKAFASRKGVVLERVENLVNEGTPDVNCATVEGGGCWIELKQQDTPPAMSSTRLLGPKGLSAVQRNWHLDWRRAGGTSWILVGVGPDLFLLVPGPLHDTVNDMTLSTMKAAAAARGWDEIDAQLRKPKNRI